jgi:hypothetical protein
MTTVVNNNNFAFGEDPSAILDQYLDEEELEKLIQKRETFSTTI